MGGTGGAGGSGAGAGGSDAEEHRWEIDVGKLEGNSLSPAEPAARDKPNPLTR